MFAASCGSLEKEAVGIYENHIDQVTEYDSILGRLCDVDDRAPATAIAKRLIRLAEQLVDVAPNDADAHQMLGLAWYHFPTASSCRSWHCRAALERSLGIDPSHPYARKYLGYLLFDQERYADALHHFAKINLDSFGGVNQEWEQLKIREVSIVCQIRVSPDELPDDFAGFCTSYIDAHARESRAYESGSTVPLQELPECAEWLFEQGADSKSTPLREILAFVGRYRSEISFWNGACESRIPASGINASAPESKH